MRLDAEARLEGLLLLVGDVDREEQPAHVVVAVLGRLGGWASSVRSCIATRHVCVAPCARTWLQNREARNSSSRISVPPTVIAASSDIAWRVDVEQRQRGEAALALVEPQAVHRVEAGAQAVGVREHHRLGLARRARGEDQLGDVGARRPPATAARPRRTISVSRRRAVPVGGSARDDDLRRRSRRPRSPARTVSR